MPNKLISRVFNKIVNRVLHTLSSFSNQKAISLSLENNPVFIVGAPRVGSTIFYQLITNELKVGYIDNAACRFYGHLPFAVWMSNKLYGDAAHNNFISELGDTGRHGGHAPSECGQFWYRWLSHDDHFVDYADLCGHTVVQIRAQISRASSIFGMPIVFKNLNIGQRLRLIHDLFPDAKIIWCRRQQEFIVQSILNVRRHLDWPSSKIWSVRPQKWQSLENLPEIPMVVEQVLDIEEQINHDIRLFKNENVKVFYLEDWCSRPQDIVNELKKWIGVPGRLNSTKAVIDTNINQITDQKLFDFIQTEFKKRCKKGHE